MKTIAGALAFLLTLHSLDSSSASPAVFYSKGVPVGVLVDLNTSGDGTPALVSKTGYLFVLQTTNGQLSHQINSLHGFISAQILYTNSDCSSPMYIPNSNLSSGFVIRDPDSEIIAYSPKGSQPVNQITLQYKIAAGNCVLHTQTFNGGRPVLTNDPQITGVQNEPYTRPFTIELAEISDCLLRDGFEVCSIQTSKN